MSLDLEPGWRERIVAHYKLAAIRLEGNPTRFVGCMLRTDVLSRVMEGAARPERTELGTGPSGVRESL